MKKRHVKFIIQLAIIALALAALLIWHDELTPENVRRVLPLSKELAAPLLVLLFAAKSLTVFMPTDILLLASVLIYDMPAAVAVNVVGMTAMFTLPYLIWYKEGPSGIDALFARHPKLGFLKTYREENRFLLVTSLRLNALLPYDAVSMYFGAERVNYAVYIAASLLGCSVHVASTTLVGSALSDPASPAFIIGLSARALLCVVPTLVLYIRGKNKNKREQSLQGTENK